MTLAALGLFVFDAYTWPFEERSRRSSWKWATAERVGARDAFQFSGPGEDEITITGAIAPEVAGAYSSIDTLRAMADQGEEYDFVDGLGRVIGSFVIVGLEEGQNALLDDGQARRTNFSLALRRTDG